MSVTLRMDRAPSEQEDQFDVTISTLALPMLFV